MNVPVSDPPGNPPGGFAYPLLLRSLLETVVEVLLRHPVIISKGNNWLYFLEFQRTNV